MSEEEQLIECFVCNKQGQKSKSFLCQHSVCVACLTDDVKNSSDDTCPACTAMNDEEDDFKKYFYPSFVLCSICEKDEGDWFCEDCDQSLCSTCSDTHKNFKLFKDHKVSKSKTEGVKLQSADRFYCVECGKVLEMKFLDTHANHKTETEIEFIREKVAEWKDEIAKIKAYEFGEKDHMRVSENKYKEKKSEMLIYKEKMKRNYQELVDILKRKEEMESEIIDVEVSKMQKEFFEHQENIEKDMISLQKRRSDIESQLKELKNGFSQDFKHQLPYELPQMHSYPIYKNDFSFQAIPKESLSNIPSCLIKNEKNVIDVYAEKERFIKTLTQYVFFQIDEKYCYAREDTDKFDQIFIFSSDTFQLFKILKCTEMWSSFSHILKVKEQFYVICIRHNHKSIYSCNEKGQTLDHFRLPADPKSFSGGETGKVIIMCEKQMICVYDVISKELEVTPVLSGIDVLITFNLLYTGEYCMYVKIKDKYKVVKVVDGNVVREVEVTDSCSLHSNGSGLVCLLDDNKNMQILNRNLNPIFKFELKIHGKLHSIHFEDDDNFQVMSKEESTNDFYLKKHKITYESYAPMKSNTSLIGGS